MGRKNVRATKPRLKRNRHAPEIPKVKKVHHGPPPPLDDMVRPVGACPTKKLRYATREDAARALRQAKAKRARLGKDESTTEKRWYECDRCDGFHLTHLAEFVQRHYA